MNARTIVYVLGTLIFLVGVVLLLLRLFSVGAPPPSLALILGCAMMLGSKLIRIHSPSKVEDR